MNVDDCVSLLETVARTDLLKAEIILAVGIHTHTHASYIRRGGQRKQQSYWSIYSIIRIKRGGKLHDISPEIHVVGSLAIEK